MIRLKCKISTARQREKLKELFDHGQVLNKILLHNLNKFIIKKIQCHHVIILHKTLLYNALFNIDGRKKDFASTFTSNNLGNTHNECQHKEILKDLYFDVDP